MVGAGSLSALDTDTVRMLGRGDETISGGCCRNMATVTQTNTNAAMVGMATRQFNKVPRIYAARISPIESDFIVRNLPATFR